jgi:hypothetical protein
MLGLAVRQSSLLGEVAEWSNAPDLKSGVRKDRGFESLPLRTVVSRLSAVCWPWVSFQREQFEAAKLA